MSHEFTFTLNVIQAFLVFTRLSAFLFAGPVFMMDQYPKRWKLFLAGAVTLLVLPVLPGTWQTSQLQGLTMFTIALLILNEVILGMTVGLIVRLLLEIIAVGGYLIDRDMGYAMTAMFDPSAQGQRTAISLIMAQTFMLLFVVHDGHHDFVRIAVASFDLVKPGGFAIHEAMVDGVLRLGTAMFVDGFRLALPVFMIIMVINVSMALITKFGQEFQVMMLSFPIRLGLGLFVLISSFPVFIAIARGLIGRLLDTVHVTLGG